MNIFECILRYMNMNSDFGMVEPYFRYRWRLSSPGSKYIVISIKMRMNLRFARYITKWRPCLSLFLHAALNWSTSSIDIKMNEDKSSSTHVEKRKADLSEKGFVSPRAFLVAHEKPMLPPTVSFW